MLEGSRHYVPKGEFHATHSRGDKGITGLQDDGLHGYAFICVIASSHSFWVTK